MRRPVIPALLLSMLLLAGGCGDDDTAGADASADAASPAIDASTPDAIDLGACGEVGVGQVNGSVLGREVAPVARVSYFEHPQVAGVFVLVLDEAAGGCAETVATGQHLVLGFPCGAAEVRSYDIAGEATMPPPDCAADAFTFALLEENGGTDVAGSVGGQLEITEVGACVAGTFTADFGGGESLSGAFNAASCTP